MADTLHITQVADAQWNNVPDELKELYVRSTEPLYMGNTPVETLAQKEARIYNSIFGEYGLTKQVSN